MVILDLLHGCSIVLPIISFFILSNSVIQSNESNSYLHMSLISCLGFEPQQQLGGNDGQLHIKSKNEIVMLLPAAV
ncbi:hypothetical protein BDZ91DRAFT_272263 [Kalaharituber pfeilii]|nr:hypothetical protein BDZ91DRAFT_272263 [Kalaharituber pfeilii]